MKVSLNTVKQYINVDLPPVDELVSRINQQLGGVEEVIDLGAKYKEAVIVKLVECDKHPDADKLSVCYIDAGDHPLASSVKDPESNLVQVVCGAPNVHADMWVVWLPPKSTVPATFDDAEPFVLGARELRGVMSNGMLASARELSLGDDHDGIVEITDNDLPQGKTLTPGESFAKIFGLDDTIIDIENKMFTHRPDLFGQLGVAREISAILQGISDKSLVDEDTRFVNPDWYWNQPQFAAGNDELELEVFNDAPSGSPRFMAVAMNGVSVEPSPLWLRCELVRWGSKSINNIVDWTNYIMLLTAQPVHAYDYDKLRGHKLGVRMAHDGEKVSLLNGKQYSLTPDDVVIADGEGAVGLAGIMGGSDSEVSAGTRRIVLEVASFDMYAVRKTSMRYGLFTDALTRFNKGQSPLQNDRIIKRLLELMPGKQASAVFDLPPQADELDQVSVHGEVLVSAGFINQRLGLELSEAQIGSLLRRVNMAVYPSQTSAGMLSVAAPYWRTDIELPEDVVEEVGRLYGFDKLPRELPSRSTKPTAVNPVIAAKQNIRVSLAKTGASEVLTYSFVHQQVIERAGQDPVQAFKLSNALSPDLQYYRLSLTPSLLDKVHPNIKSGHDEFALFEIGKSHNLNHFDDEGLPQQFDRIALTYANRKSSTGSAYYSAKKIVESLYRDCNITDRLIYRQLSEFDTMGHSSLEQMCAPFEAQRSAMIYIGDKFVGVVGEYKLAVARNFKLPQSVSGFELFVSPFVGEHNPAYQPLSRYPSSHQDISLQVDDKVSYDAVLDAVDDALASNTADLRTSIDPLAIYQADDSESKTVTLRLTVNDPQATLTDTIVSQLMDQIADSASKSLGAKRI